MSFSSSICHHGLNTAPEGDFFSSLRNCSSESMPTMDYAPGTHVTRCRWPKFETLIELISNNRNSKEQMP